MDVRWTYYIYWCGIYFVEDTVILIYILSENMARYSLLIRLKEKMAARAGSHYYFCWMRLFVLCNALIVDHTLPVHTDRKVVGVTLAIHVAAHIASNILQLLLYGLHIGGELHGQQT